MVGQGFHLTPRIKTMLYAGGTLLFVLSLGYIGLFAARNWQALGQLPRLSAGHLLLAALLYAVTLFSSGAAWVSGLRGLGQSIRYPAGIRIGLVSQAGKYLPGNVAHYVARAGLASTSGVKIVDSGIATLVEILATLFAAAAVASIAMLIDPAPAQAVDLALAPGQLIPAVLGAGAFAAAAALLRFTPIRPDALLSASGFLAVSFVLAGLSFLAVVSSFAPAATLSPIGVIGIYAVAWTAGYVVPGAPAGLGMREAILVALLTPLIGAGPAIACSLLHRVISACVDALAALAGLGWARQTKERVQWH